MRAARRCLAIGALLVGPGAEAATSPHWQLAGKTYNSVAFVDLNSVAGNGPEKRFTAVRVSGRPTSDGLVSVVQRLGVNCETRAFIDDGSQIEMSDGKVVTYPSSGANQKAFSRGVFFDMFEVVCRGREGIRVNDPKSWTLSNFKPGD
jgi:hypothetical protein